MTLIGPITEVADAWVNGSTAPDRRGENYGSTDKVVLSNGTPVKRGFVRPELPSIAGRTVLDAYAVGHAAASLASQSVTVTALDERFAEGRVNWTNQPAVNSATAVSTSVPVTAAGGVVTLTGLDAMFQSVADGGDYFGFRLTTNATTEQKFRSSESGLPAWEFWIEVSDELDPPTGLAPDGGGQVESASPILSWDPLDDQSRSWVQVDTPAAGVEPDEVSPDYSSGWQTNGDSQWSLVSRRSLVGAGPHYFRVMLESASGAQTVWSDWAEFTVAAMPSLVVDSPTGPFGDISPVVSAHLSSGTVKSWDVMVTGSARSDVRYYSELQTSPTVSVSVPENVKGKRVIREDDPGWIRIRVWPTGTWATAVDQLPYRVTWVQIVLGDDVTQSRVSNLAVAPLDVGHPRLTWSWDDTETADAYLLQVAGVTVRKVLPEELTISAGHYSVTDGGEVPPLRPNSLSVRRVEGDLRSQARTTTMAHEVYGVWLLPDDPAIGDIRLGGGEVGDFVREDAAAQYQLIDGSQVDIIYGAGNLAGAFTGGVDASEDVWAITDAVEQVAQSHTRLARMVWGSRSIMVRVRSPHSLPHATMQPHNLRHRVSFGFVEVD